MNEGRMPLTGCREGHPPPPPVGQQVDGTHPTGMHSASILFQCDIAKNPFEGEITFAIRSVRIRLMFLRIPPPTRTCLLKKYSTSAL